MVSIVAAGVTHGFRYAEERDGTTLRHRAWEALDERLVCGITGADAGDFGVTDPETPALIDTYDGLAASCGFSRVSVPMQVHGTEVTVLDNVEGAGEPSKSRLMLAGHVDGQITRTAGCLLACTAADCVPVYLWHVESGTLGLLHAGWRGVSGGILDEGLRAIQSYDKKFEGGLESTVEIRLHLGPAICGACYEVDRRVLEALGRQEDRALVDLRGVLVEQALERGIQRDFITVSTQCTRCGPEELHSYRRDGTRSGRMAAFIGLRVVATPGPVM